MRADLATLVLAATAIAFGCDDTHAPASMNEPDACTAAGCETPDSGKPPVMPEDAATPNEGGMPQPGLDAGALFDAEALPDADGLPDAHVLPDAGPEPECDDSAAVMFGACEEGESCPCVQVLGTEQHAPQGMVSTSTDVYWLNSGSYGMFHRGDGQLRSVGRAGTGALTVADRIGAPVDLALDSTTAYVSMRYEDEVVLPDTLGSIDRIPLAGGEPVTLVSGLEYSASIAVDDTHVYWRSSRGILRVRKDGSAAEEVWLPREGTSAVMVDATRVYWFEGSELFAVEKEGGDATSLGSAVHAPERPLMDDAYVYWLWSGAGDVGVDRIAKSGGEFSTVAEADGASSLALTRDGDAIFWLHRSSTGDLVRIDVTSGDRVTLPRAGLPRTLGVLEEAVYFASGFNEDETVLRMLTP